MLSLRGDCRSRLRPWIAQRLGDVQPSHGRSVEIGESASHSQRAQHEGKQDAALATEQLQCGEDDRLTNDQHHYPFEKIDLVGLHGRQ